MRKKALIATIALTLACSFTACSKKETIDNTTSTEVTPTQTVESPTETAPTTTPTENEETNDTSSTQEENYEGVVLYTTNEQSTVLEVVTQGKIGEIRTLVTFDTIGNIVDITVKEANETQDIGGLLTAENSEFIQSIIAGQKDLASVDTVSGATVTSNALLKAVNLATEYFKGL